MFFKKTNILEQLNKEELELVIKIKNKTNVYNADNISRTDAYFDFFNKNPEIIWSFLASMVSRNAGWNMCDLEGEYYPKIINEKLRKKLFLTYERANWLIFQDAFPQLLLYQYSTKINRPMFHLLSNFHVSTFMEREWLSFWERKNLKKLMISQIINEQNIIQKPVIKHPVSRKNVFQTPQFFLQDWFHYSSVLFPTCEGQLYGASANGFKSLSKRIDLGKRLADILFKNELFPQFYQFAIRTTHTGSRYDYEYYLMNNLRRSTPFLRCTYPIIKHHSYKMEDWSKTRRLKKKWLEENVNHIHPIEMTEWYLNKQVQIGKIIKILEVITT
ncbi:DUF2515 domain-containing protein [Cytobacillus depressus]|uniref:DUF2515 domain-containing protein n=1 Tax=Cytobacillus depressus TaxID=1602942 RepID=A0A6L3V9C8_9BACI|nr:DUF2515 domain-containing protein [Cytobacillus depressus]KAB2338286.1 DUF2515 domain-containing protein [Cytobacillus depressus]